MDQPTKKVYGYYRMNSHYYVYDRAFFVPGGTTPRPLKPGHEHYFETNIENAMMKHIEKINDKA